MPNVVRIQKVLFPNKPLIERLLNGMVASLATMDLPKEVKDRVKVAEWISSHNWATIAGPLQSAGLLNDFTTNCATEIAASKAAKTTDQMEKCYSDGFQSKVVNWAVAEYLKTTADPSGRTEDDTPPEDESKGMSTGTMVGIGAGVILLGGLGYYAYSKSKKNPDENPSKASSTLSRADLRRGLEIVNKDHPEWGTWRVLDKYDEGIWEIRGRRGDTTLMEDEVRFWNKVAPSKRNPTVRTGHFGYGSKPTKGLRSTLDSPAVEKAVTKLAKKNFKGAETLDIVYEHGQWWVNVFPDPDDPSGDNTATYSVVDTSSGLDVERT